MHYKKRVINEFKIWKYRWKSVGWIAGVPIIIFLILIPCLYTWLLFNSKLDIINVYTKTYWVLEILNIILCAYWPMLMMEVYVNKRSYEIFQHLCGGWKRKDRIFMYIFSMIIVSGAFFFIAVLSKSFISIEVLKKDYIILVCETLFIQGVYTVCCHKMKNTLFPMLLIFLLVIIQKQPITEGNEWFFFINGSVQHYGEDLLYVKYILAVVGSVLLGIDGWNRG